MKKAILSILAVLTLFANSWAQTEAATPTKSEKIFMSHAEESLAVIAKSAREKNITGVAVVAFIPGSETSGWTSKMKVVGRLATEKVNLASIAYSKISEMAVTLQDSGMEERKDIRGEYGYQGGIIKKVEAGYLLACFSGGTGQEDYDVAKVGVEKLSTYF